MHDVIELANRRAAALAAQDWDAVAEQLHPAFFYVNANGDRLDRDGYLTFLRDGPLRWTRQTLENIHVCVEGTTAVLAATVVDDVIVAGEANRWEFVTTQTYVNDGGWLYLAGQTAVRA